MPQYVVRYGSMRHLGVFSCRARDRYARGQRVIARTGRGQEAGEVLCEATEHVLSQMDTDGRTGQILRLLSADDDHELEKIEEQLVSERDVCRGRISELGLDMQLVEVERVYGGERAIVYFLAEQRIDFRELVKVLAKDLQTRIEMRQIGVRDEAKLLADYGDCGKPVCCNTHLSEMPPVSMKMAKLQKATLDPNKISGRCGRLKCCLRYEYDTYQELRQELPKVGVMVLTNEGKAKVLSQEILSSELLVESEDGRRVVIRADEVLTVLGKAPPKPKDKQESPPADKRSKPSSPPSENQEQGSEETTAGDKSPQKPKRRRRGRRSPRADDKPRDSNQPGDESGGSGGGEARDGGPSGGESA